MNDIYRTIAGPSEGIFKEKGSKFIAYANPVDNQEQIAGILEKTRKINHNARHHCYAWTTGVDRDKFRMNDDGEPPGTAGKPIYGQILSKNITNVIIVVVRYFGGVKLGTGGLISAYKNAAADALNNTEIVEKTINAFYSIEFDYAQISDVTRVLKENNLEPAEKQFKQKCSFILKIRKMEEQKIISRINNLNNVKNTYLYTK